MTLRRVLLVASGAIVIVVTGAVLFEMNSSYLQSRYFSTEAAKISFSLGSGPSSDTAYPVGGPYDLRYGYARMGEMISSLVDAGFAIDSQARVSLKFAEMLERGLSPIYDAKDQAGMTVLGERGDTLFRTVYPERIYPSFEAVPRLVWESLLLVENRDLLDESHPRSNAAVDWPRFIRAAISLGGRQLGRDGAVPGASTLATQLEKFRHSPGGRTGGPRDKLDQMISASYRSYSEGRETIHARQEIVRSYLNSMPLAGIPGHGEVTGMGDGLWAWFGADFNGVNALLRADVPGDIARQGEAYAQVLKLILAVQRPTYYLSDSAGRVALQSRLDRFLPLAESKGIISSSLRAAAANASTDLRRHAPEKIGQSFVEMKGANSVRVGLLSLAKLPQLYSLDRLDLTARSTINTRAQRAVSEIFTRLRDSAYVAQQGLVGFRMLDRGDPARVDYALVLYERTADANVVRIQADNVNAPFSLIEGAKLELGSSAKLRTLVSYLEAVERLYGEFHDTTSVVEVGDNRPDDALTLWSRAFLGANSAASLSELLDAAMLRRYSANPSERFFTGGGVHTFQNFESTYNNQSLTVREAFRNSINLVFIRMMRDIVNFHGERLPGHPRGMLSDKDDPRRQEYLSRFADREGRQFLARFERDHDWNSEDDALAALVEGRTLTPTRLAWAFRSVLPTAGLEQFSTFIRREASELSLSGERLLELYERTDPEQTSLVDRGYLSGIHPLELWLVRYKLEHPGATSAEVVEASATVRQEVYGWLFATRRTAAQDQRIRSILEGEAFVEIHKSWRRLGYPFASLVPSYATSIGSSADRPDQLAELVGIILNDGVRRPAIRIRRLEIAKETPYEVQLERNPPAGEQVMSPEIAGVVRNAMVDVVAEGTARRALGAVTAPDGTPYVIGAKTGTGNNRFRLVGRGGQLIEDRAINRTSTLIFFIGDRYYGSLTAFVSGREADDYGFTSSLPAQLLRLLGPTLSEMAREGGAP